MNTAQKITEKLDNSPRIEVPEFEKDFFNHLCARVPLKPISSEKEHAMTIAMISFLIDLKFEGGIMPIHLDQIDDYMATLSLLIAQYESTHFKIEKASAVDTLKYLMEQHDLTQTDLFEEIGSQPIVSKVLKGERPLKAGEIKKLSKRFRVAADVFLD